MPKKPDLHLSTILKNKNHLLSYRAYHFLLTHQTHVLGLEFVAHFDVLSVGLQVTRLRDAELVDVNTKVQIDAKCVYVRLEYGDEILVELVVHRLHVRVFDGHAENVFVESARKVAVQEFVVKNGLSNDVADEAEVTQVVRVEVRRRIGHVGDAVARIYHE